MTVLCRLMQEYEARCTAEGELDEQDLPAEMLADVEAQPSEEDRWLPFPDMCQQQMQCNLDTVTMNIPFQASKHDWCSPLRTHFCSHYPGLMVA